MDYKENYVIVNDDDTKTKPTLDVSPKYYQSRSTPRNHRYQPFPTMPNDTTISSTHSVSKTSVASALTTQRSRSSSSLYNFDHGISPIKKSPGTEPRPKPSITRRTNSSDRSSPSSMSPNDSTGSGSGSRQKSIRSATTTKTKSKHKSKIKHRQKHHRNGSGSSSSKNSKAKSIRSKYTDYEVLDTVGCGSFSRVSRVRLKSTKEVLVWKELSYGKMSDKEKQMLCDEVNILRDLNHPNIVKFVDRIIDHKDKKIFIVQEYCDGGDLASYIKAKKAKNNGRISETFIWSVTSEIASALQHCHNHFSRHNKKVKTGPSRILHRDLKPGNVFLVKNRGTYSVKLGDFGLAKELDESSMFAKTHVGTPYYMSPEQIQSECYNEKTDIWALGCIVYEMAMLMRPFQAANYLQLAQKIKLGVYKKVNTRNYSEDLEKAIQMMLTVDIKKRAKVEQLLCLPRMQFTSKLLRLDRRYNKLKKKELQLLLKMQEFEDRYKRKAKQLSDKEEALKKKEKELTQKEVYLSAKASQASNLTNSGDSGTSESTSGSGHPIDTSPGHGFGSIPSLNSMKSRDSYLPSSKSFKTPIMSPHISMPSLSDLKRTPSNGSMASMSTLNFSIKSEGATTGSTGSIEEKKEESQTASGNNTPNHDDDGEMINNWPLNENSNIPTLSEDYLVHAHKDEGNSKQNDKHNESNFTSNLMNIDEEDSRISVSGTREATGNVPRGATENLLSDARKYLMNKVNLSDLNLNTNEVTANANVNDITSRSFDYVLSQTDSPGNIGNDHNFSFKYQSHGNH